MSESLNHHYSKLEEKLNVISHGFGLVLSVIAFPFLIIKALNFDGFWKPISFIIYGLSLIIYMLHQLFITQQKTRRKEGNLIFLIMQQYMC